MSVCSYNSKTPLSNTFSRETGNWMSLNYPRSAKVWLTIYCLYVLVFFLELPVLPLHSYWFFSSWWGVSFSAVLMQLFSTATEGILDWSGNSGLLPFHLYTFFSIFSELCESGQVWSWSSATLLNAHLFIFRDKSWLLQNVGTIFWSLPLPIPPVLILASTKQLPLSELH